MATLLKIKLDKLFYESKVLLQDVLIEVQSGERILIVGQTGTGKSSLLSTLNLMNQSYQGEILFHEKTLESYKPELLRSRICMVMQEPWLEEGTIREVLDAPLAYRTRQSYRQDGREQLIQELFDNFRLSTAYLDKPASQLSGGEKQRVALIRALQFQPEILLLDEISSALDQETSGIISHCIFETYPGTVIAISHDPLWQSHWQRLWRLEDGKLSDSTQTGGR